MWYLRALLRRTLADYFSVHQRGSIATVLFQDSLSSIGYPLLSFVSEPAIARTRSLLGATEVKFKQRNCLAEYYRFPG